MYPTYQPMPMYGYTMPNRPQPRNTQPITQEMSKMIFSQEDDLSVKISPIEKLKNQCTHKIPGTGQLALVDNGDGKYTCRVCGESFHLIMDPGKEIVETTERMRDILQSIKTMYLDIPENFVKEYFQLITLLERAPALFEKASKNFQMYDQYQTSPMAVYPGMNSFQQVNSMVGGYNMGGIMPQAMYPNYAYGAPGYQQYPGQPVGQQVPVTQAQPQQQWPVNAYGQPIPPAPQMQQPVMNGYDPNGNPLMYSAPTNGTSAPAPTGPAPAAGVVPQQVQQQTANGEVTQTKAFTI